MSHFQTFLLSIIQGLTEFLPISSSAHLAVLQNFFGLKAPVFFDTLVHFGTLLAIIFYFEKRLEEIWKGWWRKEKEAKNLVWSIALGSVPVVVAGFFLESRINVIFESLKLVAVCWLVMAGILFLTRFRRLKKGNLGTKEGLLIGLAQAVAILPGISRSGITIAVGLWLGLGGTEAFEFSFLLGMPAMVGALVLEFVKGEKTVGFFQGLSGVLVAMVVGCLTLRFLKRIVEGKKYWLFGFYCLTVGLILLVLSV